MEMEENEDKILRCKICGEEFCWFLGEQKFYADRGLSEPRRCPSCRERRRAIREDVTSRINELELSGDREDETNRVVS
jgi:hypothetical protein